MRAHDFPNHELSMRLTVLGMISKNKCLKSKQNTVGVDYPITVLVLGTRAKQEEEEELSMSLAFLLFLIIVIV